MRKRILCAMFALLMVVTLLPVVAGADAKPTITFVQQETAAGASKVKIDVMLENNPGFVSATIPVKWDPSIMTLTDSIQVTNVVDQGWCGMSMDEYATNGTQGTYYLSWDNDTRTEAEGGNFTGDGKLHTLEFTLVDNTKDTATQIASELTADIANMMNYDMQDLRDSGLTAVAGMVNVTAADAGGDTPVDPTDGAKFYIENARTLKGKTVEVNLKIANNPGLAGATLSLTYDSTVLELVSVDSGDALNKLSISKNILSELATISFLNEVDNLNDNTNGTAAVLKFNVSDAAEDGEYSVGLNIISTSDAEMKIVEMTSENGSVTVFSYIVGNITGDFDEEGEAVIDIRDAVMLMQIINGYVEDVEDTVLLSANVIGDYDEDGNPIVDIRDAVKLMQYINGYITSLEN